ncbi:MAG: hypothetical protein ACQEQC_02935 [Elusimicrobiota bacterium]
MSIKSGKINSFIKFMAVIFIGVIISFLLYRYQARKNIKTEGKLLAESIASAQKIYHAKHGNFTGTGRTSISEKLGVDARSNIYFTDFEVKKADKKEYTAIIYGMKEKAPWKIVYKGYIDKPSTMEIMDRN